jgi:hypothetical protein
MQWLKRQIRNWLNDDRAERALGSSIVVEDCEPGWHDGLRINVKRVIGGFVVNFRIYDRKTDRNNDRTYLITNDQDFDTELGKMITMESMRQS